MTVLPLGALVLLLFAAPWLVWAILSSIASSRQASLLSIMRIAVDKQMPLDAAIAAYGETCGGRYRRKLVALAQLIQNGVTLPAALRKVPSMVSSQTLAAADVGQTLGDLPAALRQAAQSEAHRHRTEQNLMMRLFYFALLIASSQAIVFFISYYILWRLRYILDEFGVSLPPYSQRVFDVQEYLVQTGAMALLSVAAMLALLTAPAALAAAAWGRPLPRIAVIENLLFRSHRGSILRGIGLCVEHGRPLPAAVSTMADQYPVRRVRNRLATAVRDIQEGRPWTDALRRVGVLKRSEVDLLGAAQNGDHLAWAIGEVADGADRRFYHKLGAAIKLVGPAIVLFIGVPVGIYVAALFSILVAIMGQMS